MEHMARYQGAVGSPDRDNDIYGTGPSLLEQQQEKKSIAGCLVRDEQQQVAGLF